jgi:hypothetical protein
MAGQPAGGPRYTSPEENAAAQRRRRRRGTLITAVVALVAIAVGVAVWWNLQPDDERRVDGMNHTTLVSCEVDDEGLAVATVSVTNSSDQFSNYTVDIGFTTGDGRVLERRTLSILGVSVGETAQESTRTREPHEVELDCDIRSAFRFFAGADLGG